MRDSVNMQHVFYNKKGKEEWRYRFYLTNYLISSRISTIKSHLNWHKIKEDSLVKAKARNIQIDIEKAIKAVAKHPQKQQKLNDLNKGSNPLNKDVIKVLYIKFIAACNMLLCLVKCPKFRAFFYYLNPDIDRWLLRVHKTVRM
jgi:hypothetical protein